MGGSNTSPLTAVERLRNAGCVFAEDEAQLLTEAATSAEQLESLLLRRIDGEPLEVILGWAEFRGLRIAIDAGVFVPRRRTTGFLAGVAVALAPLTALDLCCGSGAIGAALIAEVQGVEVWACDIEPAAVACARLNLPPHRVFEGDLFAPLPPDLRFDVIVANAPYVPTGAVRGMPTEARDHEPLITLDGGADGLDVHRRIAAQANHWLVPGGSLVIEVSKDQAPELAVILQNCGFDAMIECSDDATIVRAVSRPSRTSS